MSSCTTRIDTAPVFEPLLAPARYKGAWGGRGSGKSFAFADNLIDRCLCNPGTRWLCVREIQKSLMQSAKRLIETELTRFGLGEAQGFRVLNERIETPGGGVIVFQGMQDHTADSLKSYEGFDGAWVEEAQSLSERSLTLLRPTIRKPDSELWFSWNPRRKVDPVDVMLRGEEQPTGAVVVRANWSDNPWFPAVLEQERLDCLRTNPDQYAHIWEGDYVTVVQGAYYVEQLRAAQQSGRIDEFNADPLFTYRVFCDIGGPGKSADAFAMWVAQFRKESIYVLDWYEAQGQDLGAHLAWLRGKGYSEGRTQIILPHDGAPDKGPYALSSWESAFRAAGYKDVRVVPNQGQGAAMARVKEARRLFPRIRFNRATTEGGRQALGWYHEKMHPELGVGMGPEHDFSSHSADAFGLMCVSYEEPTPQSAPQTYRQGEDYGNAGY